MLSADLLRIRNELPVPVTVAALGCEVPPSKTSEGYFHFVCPRCGAMRATVNPRYTAAIQVQFGKNCDQNLVRRLQYGACRLSQFPMGLLLSQRKARAEEGGVDSPFHVFHLELLLRSRLVLGNRWGKRWFPPLLVAARPPSHHGFAAIASARVRNAGPDPRAPVLPQSRSLSRYNGWIASWIHRRRTTEDHACPRR